MKYHCEIRNSNSWLSAVGITMYIKLMSPRQTLCQSPSVKLSTDKDWSKTKPMLWEKLILALACPKSPVLENLLLFWD